MGQQFTNAALHSTVEKLFSQKTIIKEAIYHIHKYSNWNWSSNIYQNIWKIEKNIFKKYWARNIKDVNNSMICFYCKYFMKKKEKAALLA